MILKETKIKGVTFKTVNENEVNVVLDLIKEIAIYEKMLDQVVATEETMRKSLFEEKTAKAFLINKDGENVGYCIYFFNFSTFIGRAGLYLEDIYIKKEFRNLGIGKEVFKYLAEVALENDCRRMEWSCLNWNEPSIKFYESMGAVPMSEWTVYRLTENEIKEVANR